MRRLLTCPRCKNLRLQGEHYHVDKFGFGCPGGAGMQLAKHTDNRKFDGYVPIEGYRTINKNATEVNRYRGLD